MKPMCLLLLGANLQRVPDHVTSSEVQAQLGRKVVPHSSASVWHARQETVLPRRCTSRDVGTSFVSD